MSKTDVEKKLMELANLKAQKELVRLEKKERYMLPSDDTTKLVLDFIIQHQSCKVNQISVGTGLPCTAVLNKLTTIENQGTLLTEDDNGYIAIFEK